jgi:hypothetical protein
LICLSAGGGAVATWLATDASREAVTVTLDRTVTQVETKTVELKTPPEPVIYVPGAGGSLEYKPRDVAPGVSAPGFLVKRWLTYGGETARAHAEVESNDCIPDCASGTRTRRSVTITLSRIGPCKGLPAYLQVYVEESEDTELVGDGVDLAPYCQEGESGSG